MSKELVEDRDTVSALYRDVQPGYEFTGAASHKIFNSWWCPLLLCLCIAGKALVGATQVITINTAFYALMAQRMLSGELLYVNVWDHKPPGIFFAYSLAQMAVHSVVYGTLFLHILLSCGTLLGLYVATRNITRSARAALWIGILWMLIFDTSPFMAEGPEPEAILNLIAIWTVALLSSPNRQQLNWAERVLLGMAIGFGSLVKQPMITLITPVILVFLWQQKGAVRSLFSKALAFVSIFASAGMIWLTTIAIYAAIGHFNEYMEANFSYNRYFVGSMSHNLLFALRPAFLTSHHLNMFTPMNCFAFSGYVAAAVLAFTGFRKHALLLAYLVAAQLASGMTGARAGNYWQLIVPPVLLCSAVAVTVLRNRALARATITALTTVTACLLMLCSPSPLGLYSANLAHAFGQPGYTFARRIGMTWKKHFPRENLYAIDKTASLFYVDSQLPTRYGFADAWLFGPYAPAYAELELKELRRSNPLVVFVHNEYAPTALIASRKISLPQADEEIAKKHQTEVRTINDWLLSNYSLAQTKQADSYVIFMRNDAQPAQQNELQQLIIEADQGRLIRATDRL